MAESYSLEAILSARDTNFTSTMDNAQKSMGGLSKSASGIGASIGKIAAGFGVFKAISGTISLLSSGFSSLTSELNESSIAWQTFESNMAMLGKSSGEIDSTRKSLEQFAQQTIYSASDMASTYSQMAAIGVDDTEKLVKAMGGLAASAENPQQAMKTLSQQMTQAMTKPTLSWEDFKLMLEQTPAGMAEVAKEMGYALDDFVVAVQDGEIASKDFAKAVSEVGTNEHFGSMATEFKSVGQAMDGARETIANKLMPAFEMLSAIGIKAISGLTDWIDTLDFSGLLAPIESLASMFGIATDEITAMTDTIKMSSDEIQSVADNWESMTLAEKQATVQTMGQEDLAELLEMLGVDFDSIPDEYTKEAYLNAYGKDALEEILWVTGKWHDLTLEEKRAVLEAQIDNKGLEEAIDNMGLWENAEFVSKFAEINMNDNDSGQQVLDLINYYRELDGQEPIEIEVNTQASDANTELMGLADSIKNYDWAGLGKTIRGYINSFISEFKMTGAVENFMSAFDSIKGALSNVMSSLFGGVSIDVAGLGAILGEMVSTISNVVKSIADFIASLDPSVISGFAKGIALVIAGAKGFKVFSKLSGIFSFLSFGGGMFDKLGGSARKSGGIITKVFTGIAKVIGSIGKGVANIAKGLGTGLSTAFKGLGTAISTAAKGIGTGISTILKGFGQMTKVMNPVNTLAFAGAIALVVAALALLATQSEGIAKVLKALGDAIGTIVLALGKGLATLFTAIGVALGTLAESIGTAVATIVTALTPIVEIIGTTFATIVGIIADAIVQIVQAIAPFIPAITQMVETVVDNIPLIIDAFGRLVEELGTAISLIIESLGTFVTDVGSALSEVVTAVSTGVVDIVAEFAGLVTAIGTEITNIITTVGGLATDIGSSISEVVTATSTGFVDVLAEFTTLNESIVPIIDSISGVIETMGTAISGVIDTIGDTAIKIGEAFGLIATGASDLSNVDFAGLAGNMTALAGGLGAIGLINPKSIGEGLVEISTGLGGISNVSDLAGDFEAFNTSLDGLGDKATTAGTGIATLAEPIGSIDNVSALAGDFTALNTAFSGLGASAMLGGVGLMSLSTITTTAMTSMETAITSSMTSIVGSVSLGMTNVASAVRMGTVMMNVAFRSGMNQAVITAQNTANRVVSVFSNLASRLSSAGAMAGAGFRNGLASQSSSIISTAQSIANSVSNTIQSALRIASPSKVTTYLGEMVGAGLIAGMDGMVAGVESSANRLSLATLPTTDLGSSRYGGSISGQSTSAKLDEVIDAINRGQVIMLDSGTLVGETSRQMDVALGQRGSLGGRHKL